MLHVLYVHITCTVCTCSYMTLLSKSCLEPWILVLHTVVNLTANLVLFTACEGLTSVYRCCAAYNYMQQVVSFCSTCITSPKSFWSFWNSNTNQSRVTVYAGFHSVDATFLVSTGYRLGNDSLGFHPWELICFLSNPYPIEPPTLKDTSWQRILSTCHVTVH